MFLLRVNASFYHMVTYSPLGQGGPLTGGKNFIISSSSLQFMCIFLGVHSFLWILKGVRDPKKVKKHCIRVNRVCALVLSDDVGYTFFHLYGMYIILLHGVLSDDVGYTFFHIYGMYIILLHGVLSDDVGYTLFHIYGMYIILLHGVLSDDVGYTFFHIYGMYIILLHSVLSDDVGYTFFHIYGMYIILLHGVLSSILKYFPQ